MKTLDTRSKRLLTELPQSLSWWAIVTPGRKSVGSTFYWYCVVDKHSFGPCVKSFHRILTGNPGKKRESNACHFSGSPVKIRLIVFKIIPKKHILPRKLFQKVVAPPNSKSFFKVYVKNSVSVISARKLTLLYISLKKRCAYELNTYLDKPWYGEHVVLNSCVWNL